MSHMSFKSMMNVPQEDQVLSVWLREQKSRLCYGKQYGILSFCLLLFDVLSYNYREREREREAETQEEGEAGSMPGAQHGTRSWDSRIAPWAKGRR